MSLLNRLLISVSVVILCVLVGTVALSLNAAQSYFADQLLVSSENTATSMALTLSQPSNQDTATRQLLLTALYDSGQFNQVKLTDPQDKLIFSRQSSHQAGRGGVPSWFGRLAGLNAPVSVRQVSSGWEQSAQLSVQLDASYAQQVLWNSAVRVFALVLLVGVAWSVFAVLLVRWFRRALALEVQQRLSATQGASSNLPVSPEARVAVPELEAVGSLVSDFRERVQATEFELTEKLESLNLELNSDDVTGLPNRRYFINALHASLAAEPDDAGTGRVGHVLILRLRDLAMLSRASSRAEVDDWLKGVADALSADLQEHSIMGAVVGRLNGSDFAVLLPGVAGPVATRIAQQLRQRVVMYPSPLRHKPALRWAVALADYLPGSSVGSVLARLDYRLMRAESTGSQSAIEYSSHGDVSVSLAQGGEQWRSLLQAALQEHRLSIVVEKRIYANGRQVDVHEVFLQLNEQDASQPGMSAYLFMPPAARLGLSGAFDLEGIRLAFDQLATLSSGDLIVRVSGASLLDTHFLENLRQWLSQAAENDGPRLRRLILEIDAQNLVMCAAQTRDFCRVASEFTVRVGIRRLGQRPDALMVLQMAKFHYVKLGGEFIKHLATSLGASHFVSAVIDTAHALGAHVYIEDVNDSQALSLLRAKGAYVRLD